LRASGMQCALILQLALHANTHIHGYRIPPQPVDGRTSGRLSRVSILT
jgi:hypothetical protein